MILVFIQQNQQVEHQPMTKALWIVEAFLRGPHLPVFRKTCQQFDSWENTAACSGISAEDGWILVSSLWGIGRFEQRWKLVSSRHASVGSCNAGRLRSSNDGRSKRFIFRNTLSAQEACNVMSIWNMLDSAFSFMLDIALSFSRLSKYSELLH